MPPPRESESSSGGGLWTQLASLVTATLAAACCLGLPLLVSALTAVGLGFVLRDVYLLPIFIGALALHLVFLYRSVRRHGRMIPLWLGVPGSSIALVGLLLLITGTYLERWPAYLGLAVLLAGAVSDVVARRRPRPRRAG